MGQKERREREKQHRREQILNAARTLLFTEGFNKTSVNKISKKAELSIGSIYFYFKNKEDIFAALEQEGLEILYASIQAETRDIADGVERLRKGAAVYYQFSRTHSDYFDVINYFLSDPQIFFSHDVNAAIDSKASTILGFIADIVRDGVARGVFEEPQPGNYAVFFWASLHGLIQIRKLRGTLIESEDFLSFYQYSVERLIDSIRRP
jgi:AcrR family transcriptional regulator